MTKEEIKHKKDLLYREVQEAHKKASTARQAWIEAQRRWLEFLGQLDLDP